MDPVRRKELWRILLGAWLIIGQPWPGVNAWQDLAPMRRKPFRTQAECEKKLADRRKVARAAEVALWKGARCVTREEFRGYPKCRESEPFLEGP
jgi:hypothetical protein